MAEATARAASIKRYGEALGDLALAEEWVQTSSAAVDDDCVSHASTSTAADDVATQRSARAGSPRASP